MKKLLFFSLALVFTGLLVGCAEDAEVFPEPENVSLDIVLDDHTVSCTTIATNVEDYLWDFGDGNTSTEGATVEHTYTDPGEFTITLTVTGKGGEKTVSEDITILSPLDFLTGGEGNSKTWVLSTEVLNGTGAYVVSQDWGQEEAYMLIPQATYEVIIGSEMANEFTFSYDGSYAVTPKDGTVLGSGAFYEVGLKMILQQDPGWTYNSSGLGSIGYEAKPGASFELVTGADFTLNTYHQQVITEALSETPEDISFTGVNYFTVAGEFFGALDFPTANYADITAAVPTAEAQKYIIRMLTVDEMVVSVPINGLNPSGSLPEHAVAFWTDPTNPNLGPSVYAFRPTFYLNITLKVKE
jgi:PKD repeat protein